MVGVVVVMVVEGVVVMALVMVVVVRPRPPSVRRFLLEANREVGAGRCLGTPPSGPTYRSVGPLVGPRAASTDARTHLAHHSQVGMAGTEKGRAGRTA